MSQPFLCGPDGAADPDSLNTQDRAVIADFSRFLLGEIAACPACMAPDDQCTQTKPCCPLCRGWHVSKGDQNTITKKEVQP